MAVDAAKEPNAHMLANLLIAAVTLSQDQKHAHISLMVSTATKASPASTAMPLPPKNNIGGICGCVEILSHDIKQ